MDFFETVAFPWVVGEEGTLSLDPRDRGNWTGGAVGAGQLKGTKYGVSAAAYPDLDIPNLTLQQAHDLARTRYWDPTNCGQLPPAVALCVFDFAYNAGNAEAGKVLQRSAGPGVVVDGVVGPQTLAAIRELDPRTVVTTFTDQRIAAYQKMAEFSIEGTGWTARARATEQKALCL
jgi:lysozyme family protein